MNTISQKNLGISVGKVDVRMCQNSVIQGFSSRVS
jgi:hypothetical protein